MKNIVDYFISLVTIDSESKQEKDVALKIAKDLKELGAEEVKFDNANEKTGGNIGNLYAYFKGDVKKDPILFCAHMDTVIPGKNIKPQIKDGIIFSDGTTVLGSDDKSGIAEIFWAIKTLKENNEKLPPIEVLFTISEEIGLLGAKYLDYSMIKSKFGYAFDSHRIGEIVLGAPYQNSMEYIVYGKESHAGAAPELGINAIKLSAEAITKMPLGRIDEETTSNVGIIEGGRATNIVPPKVVMKAEARSRNLDKLNDVTEKMSKALLETAEKYVLGEHKARVEIKVEREYDAFIISEDDPAVVLAKKAAEKLNIEFTSAVGGGGSDANIFNSKGVKMLIAGSGMNKVHTKEEYIPIEDLENGAKWIMEIIKLYAES
jgi:tripeptide aminopeptidase